MEQTSTTGNPEGGIHYYERRGDCTADPPGWHLTYKNILRRPQGNARLIVVLRAMEIITAWGILPPVVQEHRRKQSEEWFRGGRGLVWTRREDNNP